MNLLTLLEELIAEQRISHEVERMVQRAKIPTHVAQSLISQVDNKLRELNRLMDPLYRKRDYTGRLLVDTLPSMGWYPFKLASPTKSEGGFPITGGAFIIRRFGDGFKITTVFTNLEPMSGQPMISPQGVPLTKNGGIVDGQPMIKIAERVQQLLQLK